MTRPWVALMYTHRHLAWRVLGTRRSMSAEILKPNQVFDIDKFGNRSGCLIVDHESYLTKPSSPKLTIPRRLFASKRASPRNLLQVREKRPQTAVLSRSSLSLNQHHGEASPRGYVANCTGGRIADNPPPRQERIWSFSNPCQPANIPRS